MNIEYEVHSKQDVIDLFKSLLAGKTTTGEKIPNTDFIIELGGKNGIEVQNREACKNYIEHLTAGINAIKTFKQSNSDPEIQKCCEISLRLLCGEKTHLTQVLNKPQEVLNELLNLEGVESFEEEHDER